MFKQFLDVATSQNTSLGDINTALLVLAESQYVQSGNLEATLMTDIANTIARTLDGHVDRFDALMEIDILANQYIDSTQ